MVWLHPSSECHLTLSRCVRSSLCHFLSLRLWIQCQVGYQLWLRIFALGLFNLIHLSFLALFSFSLWIDRVVFVHFLGVNAVLISKSKWMVVYWGMCKQNCYSSSPVPQPLFQSHSRWITRLGHMRIRAFQFAPSRLCRIRRRSQIGAW